MRKFLFVTLAALMATGVYAQKGVEDGSRYGRGEDSIECLRNISIYTEYVKTENYKEAYENGWKAVFNDCPTAQNATYTNGVRILRALYKEETDPEKKAQYSNELIQVYEQRLKYLPQLNALASNPVREGEVIALYSHDYLAYNPKPDLAKAYELLRKAVTMEKDQCIYYVLADLMNVSSQRYRSNMDNEEYREALIQDYIDCANYIDPVIEAQIDDRIKQAAITTKSNIDAYFINSGAADCDDLQKIYGEKIEEHKNDLEYLSKVLDLMQLFDCTHSTAYFAAAEYVHAAAPTVQTAKGLANLYIVQRDDYETALDYYGQAVEMETDSESLSDLHFRIAQVWNMLENDDNSRSAIQKALAANPNNGNAYILLAQLYASNYKWTDDPALNRCAFFAVIDKLEQARRVDSDSTVIDRANELIRAYNAQTNNIEEDLFMLGIKPGDKLEIKGWINETVTIR